MFQHSCYLLHWSMCLRKLSLRVTFKFHWPQSIYLFPSLESTLSVNVATRHNPTWSMVPDAYKYTVVIPWPRRAAWVHRHFISQDTINRKLNDISLLVIGRFRVFLTDKIFFSSVYLSVHVRWRLLFLLDAIFARSKK